QSLAVRQQSPLVQQMLWVQCALAQSASALQVSPSRFIGGGGGAFPASGATLMPPAPAASVPACEAAPPSPARAELPPFPETPASQGSPEPPHWLIGPPPVPMLGRTSRLQAAAHARNNSQKIEALRIMKVIQRPEGDKYRTQRT